MSCHTKYVKKQVLFIDLVFFYRSMETLEQMLPVQQVAESDKKSKAQSGFKRALVLFIILMIFAIIHTIIQRLSDNNFNVLFTQLFNKMKSMEFLKNISKKIDI